MPRISGPALEQLLKRERESSFQRFRLAELMEQGERDPELLEEAKQADLERIRRQFSKDLGVSEGHPDYLAVETIASEYEGVFDNAIERQLEGEAG